MLARPSAASTDGRRIRLQTNHYWINMNLKGGSWYQYKVAFDPVKMDKENKRKVIHEACNTLKVKELLGQFVAFDGEATIYSPIQFKQDEIKFDVDMAFTEGRRPLNVKVTLKLSKQLSLAPLRDFLEKRVVDIDSALIAALDIVLRTKLSLTHVVHGLSSYSGRIAYPFERNMFQLWPGLYQSIRPGQWKLSLLADVAHSAFYEEVSVLDFAAAVLRLRDARELEGGFRDDRQQMQFLKAIKGLRIVTTHGRKRSYKVIGVGAQRVKDINFPKFKSKRETGDGEPDTVGTMVNMVDYFESTYQIRLSNVRLPPLQMAPKFKNTYIPMELCRIAPRQRYIKAMPDRLKADMIKKCATKPVERFRNIQSHLDGAHFSSDEYLKGFGVDVSPTPADIEARLLDAPTLQFQGQNETPRYGTWDLRGKRMTDLRDLENWAILCYDQRLEAPTVKAFFEGFIDIARNHGFNMTAKPAGFQKASPDSPDLEADARHFADSCPSAHLIFVILPDKTQSFYSQIKHIFDSKLGRLTQCLVSDKFQRGKGSPQLYSNILLKVNVKLGGFNHSVNPQGSTLASVPTLLLGIDVSHPSPGARQSPSFAAVVGSMNLEGTRYVARSSKMPFRQEVVGVNQTPLGEGKFPPRPTYTRAPENIPVLEDIVYEMLVKFYKSTRVKPERIIVYRDGVSESQYPDVLTVELTSVRRACARLPGDYRPGITFCVLQTHHHTRFFQSDGKLCDKSGNALPGTIVDSGISKTNIFDFFLLSHSGIQGTSRPTYYAVLWDDNAFTQSEFQRLTYNLCYLFQRCTRSISMVAPVYYASMVAARQRMYLRGAVHGEGSIISGGSFPRDASAEEYDDLSQELCDEMYYV